MLYFCLTILKLLRSKQLSLSIWGTCIIIVLVYLIQPIITTAQLLLRTVLLLHQLFLVCQYVFLVGLRSIYFLNVFRHSRTLCYTLLVYQILLFYNTARHLLLPWYSAWRSNMVFSSACNNSTRLVVFLFERDLLRLSYWFIVLTHWTYHCWLVVLENYVLVLLLGWWCLTTR